MDLTTYTGGLGLSHVSALLELARVAIEPDFGKELITEQRLHSRQWRADCAPVVVSIVR